MRDSDSEPKTIGDYFAALIEALDTNLPEGNVGQNNGFYLHSQYVGRDNKRRIVLFVTHGKPAIARQLTRVTYILPVPAKGARLFKLEGLQPATAATFDDMELAAGQDAATAIASYAAANNIALWHAELARVAALEAETPAGSKKTMLHNLGIYWRGMQRLLFDAVANTDIKMTRSLSDRTVASSNSAARSHHASNPRSSSSARSSSGSRRRTSSRSTGRRTSSRSTGRRTSSRSTGRRTSSRRSPKTSSPRRRTRSGSNSDPRRPTKKPNSDPT
jgi:hypothetical protein